jgi:hypothetical protein
MPWALQTDPTGFFVYLRARVTFIDCTAAPRAVTDATHPPLARNLSSMMQLSFLKWLSWPTLIRLEGSVDLLDQCPTESPTRMWGKGEMQQSNDLNHDRLMERTRIEFSFFNDYGTISLILFSASRNLKVFSVHKRPKAQFVIQVGDMIPPVFSC